MCNDPLFTLYEIHFTNCELHYMRYEKGVGMV